MTGVTVVIPTRGAPRYLAEAVASAAADGAAEILVVENGTRAVADELVRPARVLRLGPVGRSRARNAGVRAARTPLVAFLDADDVSLSGRLARQQAALERAPGAALAFGAVEAFDAEGRHLEAESAAERRRYVALLARGADGVGLLVDCPIWTSATTVRRDAFLAAGGYDPRLDAYEDLDLYLRLARAGGLVPTPGPPVSRHRKHAGNTPSDLLFAGALRLAEKHLQEAAGAERRLLLERRLDSLWGLGDFAGARAHALAALRAEPRLGTHPRFAKRLAASLLPRPLLEELRAR